MRQIKKILFDDKKALDVFEILSKLWVNKHDVFEKITLRQNSMPDIQDPVQKANFIFFLIMAERGPISSERVNKWYRKLWETNPNIFNPRNATSLDKTRLVEIFVKSRIMTDGNNFLFKEFFDSWINNLKIINEKYKNNILNIFRETQSFGQTLEIFKTQGIQGIQTKLLAYLITLLQEEKLISYFAAPIPADFHRLRILWSTEIMDLSAFEQTFLELPGAVKVNLWYTHNNQVAAWSENFFKKHDLSHLIIGPALWHFSRQRCALVNKKNIIDQQICLTCPISNFCHWIIPSRYFYHKKPKRNSYLIRFKRNK